MSFSLLFRTKQENSNFLDSGINLSNENVRAFMRAVGFNFDLDQVEVIELEEFTNKLIEFVNDSTAPNGGEPMTREGGIESCVMIGWGREDGYFKARALECLAAAKAAREKGCEVAYWA